VHLESKEGRLDVQGGRGDLRVALNQGRGEIRDFRGAVVASGDETAWKLRLAAPSDVNVISSSGDVAMDWSGGAKIFLTTTSGDLLKSSPEFPYLHALENGGHRALTGLKSGKMRGEVFVRTQSGAISWNEGKVSRQ
jgi:hypothetical protein